MTNIAHAASYNECEKRLEMYYELYVDSIFLVNFVMNLYLLLLVNQSTLRTATRRRIVLGAAVGALGYLLPFVLPAPPLVRYLTGVILGGGGMLFITFRPKSAGSLCRFLRSLLWYTFVLGGLLSVSGALFFGGLEIPMGCMAVMGVGALGTMLISFCLEKRRGQSMNGACLVCLKNGSRVVRAEGLIDSGNSLREPISNAPVSIMEPAVFSELMGEEEWPFRAIPYRSIGKKRGILRGYRIPELEISVDGITKQFHEVYVAVGEQGEVVPVIIHPELMK